MIFSNEDTMRLYLDTSVIGALLDIEIPQRVEVTRAMIDLIIDGTHTGILSNIVLEEIERAPEVIKERLLAEIRDVPFQMIIEDEASANLLSIYEKEGFIRKGARLDLRHLSVATVSGVDAIVSWNFRDIVNIRTRRAVHSLNLRHGFPLLEIVSPEEVIEYED